MASKISADLQAVLDLLPANGSEIFHRDWRAAIINAGKLSSLRLMREAQRSGEAVFRIGDHDDPAGTLMVSRKPAAPNA